MSTVEAPVQRSSPGSSRAAVRALRILGWTLVLAGVVVLLYLVYSLLFTRFQTSAAQAELLERWELEVGDPVQELPGEPDQVAPADIGPVDPGDAVAVLQFARPGSDVRPVRQDPLFVVSGVDLTTLQSGPGHYPETALPGQDGNFAVAGHRTTYGAPFFNLDQLRAGDEVHVTGRDGVTYVYVVRESRVVRPDELWVVEPDPLGTGRPTLTLTTCHPRFSNAQRLIVFAELVESASAVAVP